jgi:ABC-type sulfate transport system substrate-binding protein
LGAWLAWDGLLEPTLAAVIPPKRSGNAYQDFLTLWKDADPDIPILKQAKPEYAELQ